MRAKRHLSITRLKSHDRNHVAIPIG